MLIDYIEELRKQPRDVRERAVMYWTVVLVAIIVAIFIGIRIVMAVMSDGGTVPDTSSIASPYGSVNE